MGQYNVINVYWIPLLSFHIKYVTIGSILMTIRSHKQTCARCYLVSWEEPKVLPNDLHNVSLIANQCNSITLHCYFCTLWKFYNVTNYILINYYNNMFQMVQLRIFGCLISCILNKSTLLCGDFNMNISDHWMHTSLIGTDMPYRIC